MGLISIGEAAAEQLLGRVLSAGKGSSEYYAMLSGMALATLAGIGYALGYEIPIAIPAMVTFLAAAYILSRHTLKDKVANVAKASTGAALALMIAACTGTVLEDPRVQLAKSCELYAAAVNTATVAVQQGKFTEPQLDVFEAVLDEGTPICTAQDSVTPLTAVSAVERLLLELNRLNLEAK